MKEQSDIQAITRIGYAIGLVFGGGMLLLVGSYAIPCNNAQCSQFELLIAVVGISLQIGGGVLFYIIMKSPKTKDVPSGSEYYLDDILGDK